MPNETQYIPEGSTTLNGLTGEVTLAAGSNITITPSGNTLTIASSGGGGGNGFAAGATVAGSTGNTPTGGFTLDDGSGGTITIDPNANSAVFTIASGTTSTIGVNGTTGSNTGGDNFHLFAGGLIIGGAGITTINADATVPSTTWNDGIGHTTQMFASAVIFTAPNGDTSEIDPARIVLTPIAGGGITLDAGAGELNFVDAAQNGINVVPGAAGVVAPGQIGLGSTHQTTVGTLGAASALPALPSGYWLFNVEGTNFVIPYYKAS